MTPIAFTPLEAQIVEGAAHPERTIRRKRTVVAYALILVLLIIGLGFLPVSRTFFVAGFAGYVLITLGEKVAYANAVLAYKSVIRKLLAKE